MAVADPATRAVCVVVLAGLGMRHAAVGTGVAAVVEARRRPPDVLLVEGQLEDVPGLEALAWLRSNPALGARPFVMLVDAGSAVPETGRRGAVLRKPVAARDLRATLIRLIGGSPEAA